MKILGFYFGRKKQPTAEQMLDRFNKTYSICMRTYDSKLQQHTMEYNNILKKLNKIIELLESTE